MNRLPLLAVLLLLPTLLFAQSLGTVNGEPIDTAECRRRVERARAALKHRPASFEEFELRQSVWEQIVVEMLLKQGAQRLGVVIDREAPGRLMRESDTADPLVMRDLWLDSMGVRISRILTQDETPSDTELRLMHAAPLLIASGTVASYDVNLVDPSGVEISAAEIDSVCAREGGCGLPFQMRQLRYVGITPRPSATDTVATLRRLVELRRRLEGISSAEERDRLYAEWSHKHGDGEFRPTADAEIYRVGRHLVDTLRTAATGSILGPLDIDRFPRIIEVVEAADDGPEAVRVLRVFVGTRLDPSRRDSARRVATALAQRARAGESFEALVREHSSAGGYDFGWLTEEMMEDELRERLFAAAPGTVIGPIEAKHGWYVAAVTGRSSRRYRLRDWRLDIEATEGPRAEALARAERIRLALAAGDDPDDVARREVVTFEITSPLRPNENALESVRLGRFAFDGRLGDVSPVIDFGWRYVVAQVASILDSGRVLFAPSEGWQYRSLLDDKRVDRLMAHARILRAGLPHGYMLASVSQVDPDLTIVPFGDASFRASIPYFDDSVLTRAALTVPLGEISQPIRGARGVYFIQLASRELPTEEDFLEARDNLIESLNDNRRRATYIEWFRAEHVRAVITGWPE